MRTTDVVVIGAGISGLSVARALALAGHTVHVTSDKPPLETTSAVAPALWFPFTTEDSQRALDWALVSYFHFEALAALPETGVMMRSCVDLHRRKLPAPPWAPHVRRSGMLGPNDVKPPFVEAFTCQVPVIEAPRHLEWLISELRRLNVSLSFDGPSVASFEGISARVIVNCTGMGARVLCQDHELLPVKGQVLRVERGDAKECLHDDEHPRGITYVIPRSQDLVIGATVEPGLDDRERDEEKLSLLRQNAETLIEGIGDRKILSSGVGVRPFRPKVRLEVETRGSGPPVVHNYGHGGSGWTLSEGCAREVAELVASLLR